MADLLAVVKPYYPELSSKARNSKSNKEPEKTQYKDVKEVTPVVVQQFSVSGGTGDRTLEELGTEKPENRLGCLSGEERAIHKEQQQEATKNLNGVPMQSLLPLHQRHSCNIMERQASVEILNQEMVTRVRSSRIPQIEGDPLSVSDDSISSEMSNEEGRLPNIGPQTHGSPEEQSAGDIDELIHSLAIDDSDSSASDYSHPSLLAQMLESDTLDSRSMIKLQNISHEYERSVEKARSRNVYLSDKVSRLDLERAEIKSSLKKAAEDKFALECKQMESQTEVTNLKFQLKREQENHSNAIMMYNTIRDELRRTEEHHQFEIQERQRLELTVRKLELETRILVNNMKQLEEDNNETQRQLAQERTARKLQEEFLNSRLRKQHEIEEENTRNISKSNDAFSQLTKAGERETELLQQNNTLKEQLTILKINLEHSQVNRSLKESNILEENEALKEQLEDAQQDLKLNNNALSNCQNEVNNLKNILSVMKSHLENERQTRGKLEVEVESNRTRLAVAVKEAEHYLAAQANTEKALLQEKEEHQRLKDRLTIEAASQFDTWSSLSPKMAKAETCDNTMENGVHWVTLQLTEKGLLLDDQILEEDEAAIHDKGLKMALRAGCKLISHTKGKEEASQELLAHGKCEDILLRQHLENTHNKGVAKECTGTDEQDSFSDNFSHLRCDCEERLHLVEEKNKELVIKAANLQDQIFQLGEEKNERENYLRQLQQELTDSLKKLSINEASLDLNSRYRNDLEKEKTQLLEEMDKLKEKLEEKEDHCVQADKRMNSVKSTLDEREKELTAELKIHTKLGLRLAELEKEKGELTTQIEIEEQKAKKITEQSKAVETCLGQEMKRNTELQKEMYRLRILMKTAKKKLRDQEAGRAVIGFSMNRPQMEMGRHSLAEEGLRRMKEQLDDLQVQLEKEATRCSQLDEVNGELKDQLVSLKSLLRNSDQLERSKRLLEEEVSDLRRQMEASQLEKSQAVQYRRDAEKWANQDIKQKLDQVNMFLQSQAASQEALDQIKAANEANMRSRLEQKIRELEGELGHTRTTLQENLNQRDSTCTELERYRHLYTEELCLRKSLASKLERANIRLTKSNVKFLNEHNRPLMIRSIANSRLGSPSLDMGTFRSPANYGVSMEALNKSIGLEQNNHLVEDHLAKLQSEFDIKSISKELNNAKAELQIASTCMSPVDSVSKMELHPVSSITSVGDL